MSESHVKRIHREAPFKFAAALKHTKEMVDIVFRILHAIKQSVQRSSDAVILEVEDPCYNA
jgi:hypothetical protein